MTDEDSVQVRVKTVTWQKLNAMKLPGKTFDDVITKLIDEIKVQ